MTLIHNFGNFRLADLNQIISWFEIFIEQNKQGNYQFKFGFRFKVGNSCK